MKKAVVLLFIFFSVQEMIAQEMWGISNSNFAGQMGMGLNPSTMVAAPYSFEINLISGDIFIQNSYIYIKRRSSLIAKSVKGEAVSDDRISDRYTNTLKSGYAQILLKGPSLLINRGNFAFGLHTAMRMGLSARRVPFHLAKFMYKGFNYDPQHGIPFHSGAFQAAMLHWSEIGLSGGMVLNESGENLLTGAVTLKYLLPLNALFIDVGSIDYLVPSSDLLIVENLSGSYGHTAFDQDGNMTGQLFSIKGQGFGGDIGFTWMVGRLERAYECGKRSRAFRKYKFRTGFSLVDLGYARLSSNAGVYSFRNRSMQWPGMDTVKFSGLSAFDSSLSSHFFNDPEASRSGDGFSMMTPVAASIQVDYCLAPGWYVNASVIQRIPLGKNRILRPNQLSITPRYETRNLEVALPFSLYDYTRPRFGLALRYGFFVLGTDKIGAFTGLWDVSGADIYFGIKVAGCGKMRKKSRGGDCYDF